MYKVSYMGNGSTTEFNFNFPFYENTNIIVAKNGTTITTGYTIVGTSAGENADIPYTGGKVIFESAPISTDSITISRSLPLTRIVDYQPTELINPTVLNQDQNYTMEVLKDFSDKIEDFDEKYEAIIDEESTQILVQKIDTVSQQITDLGDVSTLRQNVDDLITTTGNHTTTINEHTNTIASHTTTIGSHTTSIGTLDNRTTGMIDYVIESQTPSAENNYTWYRKYKSGWVEQGGEFTPITSSSNTWKNFTVTLPVEMANSHYCVMANDTGIGSAGSTGTIIEDCTTTSFKWSYFNASNTAHCYWYVSGMSNNN